MEQQTIEKPLQFEILSPTNDNFANVITFNFDELKTNLKKRLNHYETLVYNDDQIKQAKEDRASLNKLKTNIDNERKRIKKEIFKEYTPFEDKVKELIALCDAPIDKINEKISSYENEQKNIKREELRNYYIGLAAAKQNFDFLTFEQIEKTEWSNLSFSTTKAKKAIDEAVEKITNDFLTLETFTEYKAQLTKKYIETLDLGEVLREKAKLEEMAKIIKAQEAQEHVQNSSEMEKYSEGAQNATTGTPACSNQIFYTKTFTVRATKEQLIELNNCLMLNNIEYEIKGD